MRTILTFKRANNSVRYALFCADAAVAAAARRYGSIIIDIRAAIRYKMNATAPLLRRRAV